MSDEPVVIQVFSNEADAGMAEEILKEAGVRALILKDDAGGMEPHLQLTGGVRLLVASGDADRAREIIENMFSD